MLQRRGLAQVSFYALALLAAAAPVVCDVSFAADELQLIAASQQPPEPTPDTAAAEPWSEMAESDCASSTDHIVRIDQRATGEPMEMGDGCDDGWTRQWVPAGLIYHS